MGGYRTKVTAATPQLLPTGQIGAFVSAALERGDSVQYVPAQISLPFTDIVTVTTLALPVGLEGFAYTAALAALGGTLPYTWGASGLPSWATLSGNTISGTPNSTAPSTLTVTATDADGRVSLPVVLSLTVSGVGLGVFAYAGGSDQRAYVVPGPGIVAAALPPPTNPGPQAMWPGYADTQSLSFYWWSPTAQTTWVGAAFTGSVTSGVLTVLPNSADTPLTGALAVGQPLQGGLNTNVGPGITITGQLTNTNSGGTPWQDGTYSLSSNFTLAQQTMYCIAVGAPQYYEVFRDGTLICGGLTNTTGLYNPGVTASPIPVNGIGEPNRPIPWYTDRPPDTNPHVYTVKGSVNGVLSVAGPALTMQLLTPGASQPPAAPVYPATWVQDGSGAVNINTFVLPPGATYWTATNTSSSSVSGTGTGGATGCSYAWALAGALAAGGNHVIVLTAGANYPVAAGQGTGYVIPAFEGSGWVYVISNQEPVYQESIGGSGTLIPYNGTAPKIIYQAITCTGSTIAANATSATLSPNQSGWTDSAGNWVPKTGWYWCWFTEGTGATAIQEERQVSFVQGSSTINWGATNGLLPSAGLAAAASVTVLVGYLPGVTPPDAVNMPTIQCGTLANQSCITMTQATGGVTNKVRFVGINFAPLPSLAQSSLVLVSYTAGVTPPPPCNHNYFDRCLLGNDTFSPMYSQIVHGFGAVNCNNFFVNQCYEWGIAHPSDPAGDANNYVLDGGPHAWRSNYIQCTSEGVIYGGAGVGQFSQPHDIVFQGNMTHKPAAWTGGSTVAVQTWIGGSGGASLGATGATLTVPWAFATGSYTLSFTDGSSRRSAVTLTNGSASVSWGTALTVSQPTNTIFVNGGSVLVGGIPWQLFGSGVKNHFECKAAQRVEAWDNLMVNCWVGQVAGYHSSGFAVGARDQNISAAAATNANQCCPWVQVSSVNYYNNLEYNVGSPFYIFTGDACPSASTSQFRFVNNSGTLNPTLPQSERVYGMHIQGPVPDLIVQHNTFLVNTHAYTGNTGLQFGMTWVAGGTGAGGYLVTKPYGPTDWDNFQDRATITDNIVDSGNPAATGQTSLAFNFALSDGLSLAQFPAASLDVGKNLIINDLNTTYTNSTSSGILYVPNTLVAGSGLYGAIGFATAVVGGNLIPNQPSDFNVVSGTFATASTTGGPVGATVVPPQGLQFPLVGGVYIAGSVQTSFGTSAFQDAIANNNDVAVIGTYPGWTGGGFTMASAAAAIKAINPTIKLVPYTNIMELEAGVGPSGSAYSPIFNAATTMNWFLRTAWPSGSITDADGNAQDGLNQTTFTVAGTGSYAGYANYLAWRASWTAANEYPGSNWDGVYLDNVFSIPRVSADYNQSGSSQTASAAKTNWQNGYVAYAAPGGYLRTALPAGKLVFGNSADWANTSVTAYNGMLDGPVIEGVTTYQTTWATQIAAYKASMLNTRTPSFAIYCQDGVVTNYQFFRYGFTMCLLDNAYYYHSNNGSYDTVEVYDEYSFNLGAPIAGPNNAGNGTLSSGGLTVWKSQGPSGVWRRDFVNGIAICNPAGNGSQSVVVDVSVNYWHLRGTQANPPNSATEVTAGSSVTLADGDGLILSRTAT